MLLLQNRYRFRCVAVTAPLHDRCVTVAKLLQQGYVLYRYRYNNRFRLSNGNGKGRTPNATILHIKEFKLNLQKENLFLKM
jgi:hypothetical protein